MASNSAAPCLLDLPVELLHMIFRCILDESSTCEDTRPRNDLIALSQTSSQMSSLAISFVHECMSFEKVITWKKHLRVIKTNPDHALWVKKLRVVSYEEGCLRWRGFVPSGLHVFAGIRKLILEGHSMPPMLGKLPRNCDLFPFLQFCKIIYRDWGAGQIPLNIESLYSIWTSRDLRYLYLEGLGFISSNEESVDLQKKLKPVELLVVHDCMLNSAKPAQFLPYRDVVQLILRGTEQGWELEPFIHNFTETLVSLEYDPHEEVLYHEDMPAVIKWPDLRSCKTLKTLKITAFSVFEMIRMGPYSNTPSRIMAELPDTLQTLHLVVATWSISRSPFYEALHTILGYKLFKFQSLKLQLLIDPSARCWRQAGQHEDTEERVRNPEDYMDAIENTSVSEICKIEGIAFEITAEYFSGIEPEDELSWTTKMLSGSRN